MEDAPAYYLMNQEAICSFDSCIGDTPYKIKLSKIGDEINIEALSLDTLVIDNYMANFSLTAIQGLGKIFKYCENILEIADTLKNLILQKNYKVNLTSDKSIIIIDFNTTLPTGKEEIASFKLLKLINDTSKTVDQLFKELRRTKRDNIIMRDEIENLKSEVTSLKEQKDILQKEIETLKNTINSILEVTMPISIENKKIAEKQKELIKVSSLLCGLEEIKLIINALGRTQAFKDVEFIKMEFSLLYSTNKDLWNSNGFHQKCDNHKNTLILIRTTENCIFGGFTSQLWNHGKGYLKDDDNAFIFSFETMKYYSVTKGKEAIYTNNKGPCFNSYGFIIYINDFNLKTGKTTEAKNSYYNGISKDYEINGGKQKFDIWQLDVIEIGYY